MFITSLIVYIVCFATWTDTWLTSSHTLMYTNLRKFKSLLILFNLSCFVSGESDIWILAFNPTIIHLMSWLNFPVNFVTHHLFIYVIGCYQPWELIYFTLRTISFTRTKNTLVDDTFRRKNTRYWWVGFIDNIVFINISNNCPFLSQLKLFLFIFVIIVEKAVFNFTNY